MPGMGDGRAIARGYINRIWRTVVLGTVVGALFIILTTAFGTSQDPDPVHAVRNAEFNMMLAAGIIAAFVVATRFFTQRAFGPAAAWLVNGGTPAPEERRSLDALPSKAVMWSIGSWIAAFAVSLPADAVGIKSPLTTRIVIQAVVAYVCGATTSCILTYLLLERMLRPLTGLAAETSGSPRPSPLGIFPRLLMAFVAGVASPLISLGVGLVGLTERQRIGTVPVVWVTICVVFTSGFFIAVVAARAVTEPMDEIRRRFARLRAGNLDVEVEVNEPGEIGELQVGFNDMVKALREREQMRDVFVRLVGKDVAEHALEHSSEFGGEARQATAMFVDIIGSTPLAQSSSPQDYLAHLNSFFDVVVRAVENAGGVVNQFQGDGALCIFGAPSDQPDHAVRALRAARELRVELDRFAQTSGIEAVLGLSTGDVIAGQVGTPERYEFTVVGDAVNEAKRLAEQAKMAESKVLVSEATIRAAEGEVGNWNEATSIQLRGRSQPTNTFTPRP